MYKYVICDINNIMCNVIGDVIEILHVFKIMLISVEASLIGFYMYSPWYPQI